MLSLGCVRRLGIKQPHLLADSAAAAPLVLQIEYPEIEEGTKPRHRVMSSYEQRKEPWSKEWQYLLFAAEPYVSARWPAAGPTAPGGVLPLLGKLADTFMPGNAYIISPRRPNGTRLGVQEVIAFKIPSLEVDKHPEKLFTHW